MTKVELLQMPQWHDFDTIELSEMKAVKLMNRVDTKYVANSNMLADLLDASKDDYLVQIIDNSQIASYDTLYYDTSDLTMYKIHHDRFLVRDKVRTRTYLDTSVSYLEVKHKNNKGRTKKKRVAISREDFGNFIVNTDARDFLEQKVVYKGDDLMPQLRTIFNRITLVNKARTERLTIDLNLKFVNQQTGITKEMPNLMIIELKQDGLIASEMKTILSDLHVPAYRISKYCIGTVLTNPTIKYNRFKKKVIYINKLQKRK